MTTEERMQEAAKKLVAEMYPRSKPKPKADVPTIRFDIPKLTPEDIVHAVETGHGPWRTLQSLHEEDVATKRAKALERRYGMTPIPEPDGFWGEDL